MKTFIVGLLVFSFFFSVGIVLARHKPLWTDELYGQQFTIQGKSWSNIFFAQHGEINLFPASRALQKGFLQLIHWQLPFVWDGDTWFVAHPQAQLILRVLPDILMSLAMTAIVLFFGVRAGFVGGVVAALICLSMPMVWLYWVEARFYPLWFMLTVFQSLLFLDIISKKETHPPVIPLAFVHAGLCLTAPLGLVQTIICLGLLWCAGIRRGKFHMMAGAVPLFLGAYYFYAQGQMKMFVAVSWQDLFFYNFPLEGLILLGMYVIVLFLSRQEESLQKCFLFGRIFLPFCLAFMAIALVGVFFAVCKSSIPHIVPVVPRHFIFLTPVAIIMMAAVFSDFWLASAKCVWWRSVILIIFLTGLLSQLLSVYVIVNKLGVYF